MAWQPNHNRHAHVRRDSIPWDKNAVFPSTHIELSIFLHWCLILFENGTRAYFDYAHKHYLQDTVLMMITVYPKKYAHGFCFAVLCCGYTLTDFPISIRLTSLALWQSNDCPSASKATLMNMDKYFMWIHYERFHNQNKAKHNKTVCIFLGIYCNWYKRSKWSIICNSGCRTILLFTTIEAEWTYQTALITWTF